MVILRTLLMLCGALAVLTLGALPAAADPATPPCHEMSGPADDAPSAPAKAIKVMACCVMCVAAPAVPPVQPAASPLTGVNHHARPAARLSGRGPAPEHGPPRA